MEVSVEVLQNARHKSTIGSSYTTHGHIAKGLYILILTHTCSLLSGYEDGLDVYQPMTGEWKCVMKVHIHIGICRILFSCEEKENHQMFQWMDGIGNNHFDSCSKQTNPICSLHDIIHKWFQTVHRKTSRNNQQFQQYGRIQNQHTKLNHFSIHHQQTQSTGLWTCSIHSDLKTKTKTNLGINLVKFYNENIKPLKN